MQISSLLCDRVIHKTHMCHTYIPLYFPSLRCVVSVSAYLIIAIKMFTCLNLQFITRKFIILETILAMYVHWPMYFNTQLPTITGWVKKPHKASNIHNSMCILAVFKFLLLKYIQSHMQTYISM